MSLSNVVPYDVWLLLSDNPDIKEGWNLVLNFFEGDGEKALRWYRTSNPLLGDQVPMVMIINGREKKLLTFIKGQINTEGV